MGDTGHKSDVKYNTFIELSQRMSEIYLSY